MENREIEKLLSDYLDLVKFTKKESILKINAVLSHGNVLPPENRIEFSMSLQEEKNSLLRLIWYGLFKEKDQNKIIGIINILYGDSHTKKIRNAFSIFDKNCELAFGLDWENYEKRPRLKLYFYALEQFSKEWNLDKLKGISGSFGIITDKKGLCSTFRGEISIICVDIKDNGSFDIKVYAKRNTGFADLLETADEMGFSIKEDIQLPDKENFRVYECYRYSRKSVPVKTLYISTREVGEHFQNAHQVAALMKTELSTEAIASINLLLSNSFIPSYVSLKQSNEQKTSKNIYFMKKNS